MTAIKEISPDVIRAALSGSDPVPELLIAAHRDWTDALDALVARPRALLLADRLETVTLPPAVMHATDAQAAYEAAQAALPAALEAIPVDKPEPDRSLCVTELHNALRAAQNAATSSANAPRIISAAIESLRSVPAPDPALLEALGLQIAVPETETALEEAPC